VTQADVDADAAVVDGYYPFSGPVDDDDDDAYDVDADADRVVVMPLPCSC